MTREPLGKIALAAGLIVAVLGLFGVHLSQEQVDAVTNVFVAAAPLISGVTVWWVGRQKVTPIESPRDAAGNDLVPAATAPFLGDVEDA
jgi:uncharacterized membrane protein (DUF441 family)